MGSYNCLLGWGGNQVEERLGGYSSLNTFCNFVFLNNVKIIIEYLKKLLITYSQIKKKKKLYYLFTKEFRVVPMEFDLGTMHSPSALSLWN